ncbi:MAG: hypothetical protein HY552_06335 [Elusimicrobia bacterium]|nr:hypothetical protein [Elusimicrobiota bacterium]
MPQSLLPSAVSADLKTPNVLCDVSKLFPKGIGDQSQAGSCFAFASIGLVESALLRAGHPIRLSEADLFLRYGLLDLDSSYFPYEKLLEGKPIEPEDFQRGGCQGGAVGAIFHFGVVTQEAVPYAPFMSCSADSQQRGRYDKYRRLLAAIFNTIQTKYMPALRREYKTDESLRAVVKLIVRNMVQRALTDVKFQADLAALGMQANDTRVATNIEALLNPAASDRASEQKLEQERLKIKRLIDENDLNYFLWTALRDEEKHDLKRILLDQLCQGRPVGVDMRISAALGFSGSPNSYHAFIVTGFDPAHQRFLLRNSWGPQDNSYLDAAQMRKEDVIQMVWITTLKDHLFADSRHKVTGRLEDSVPGYGPSRPRYRGPIPRGQRY